MIPVAQFCEIIRRNSKSFILQLNLRIPGGNCSPRVILLYFCIGLCAEELLQKTVSLCFYEYFFVVILIFRVFILLHYTTSPEFRQSPEMLLKCYENNETLGENQKFLIVSLLISDMFISECF